MIPTGHEDEFRGLFAEEAGAQLARIAEHALTLEADATDPDVLSSLFRDAHTLKGAAGIVGCDEVARVAHMMEEVFDAVRSGTRAWDATVADGTLVAVDAVREMVAGMMAGERRAELAVPALAVLEQLLPAAGQPAAVPAPAAGPAPVPEPDSVSEAPGARSATASEGEIVRVPLERLEELIRLAGQSTAAQLRVGELIRDHTGIAPETLGDYRELTTVLAELSARTMRARMVTLATISVPLRRTVRDVARATGKPARLELEGDHVELDRRVLDELRDPLMHLLRNAVDHGLEAPELRAAMGKAPEGVIRLTARRAGSQLVIAVSDDGGGVKLERLRERFGAELSDDEAIELLFQAGTSTAETVTDISGRGVGLDVVAARIAALRGEITVDNRPAVGTTFLLNVPVTLSILPSLVVSVGERRFAVPLDDIDMILDEPASSEISIDGRPAIWAGSEPVEIGSLSTVLGGPDAGCAGPVVVLSAEGNRYAVRVDRLHGQRDAIIKQISSVVGHVDAVLGASIEPDGSIMLVLDAGGLIARGQDRPRQPGTAPVIALEPAVHERRAAASLLVVDDALTVRELQRTFLVRAGHTVRVASHGREALDLLEEEPADLVLSDLEMPEMDGLALCRGIRSHPRLSSIPVVVFTSRDSAESRRAALDSGADAYIIKSEFDEATLLATVERLLASRDAEAA